MASLDIISMFLNPSSVAVIGASKNPVKGGNRIVHNLTLNNFNGKVYPVNPNSNGKVYGLEFYKNVLDIEDDVDLAIFYIPNRLIPGILKECIKKNIKGAIIEASGFEEVGEIGLKLRDEILEITDNFSKIRVVGPNCMGLSRIDVDSDKADKGGFFSGFGTFFQYRRGNIGVITQSGMLNGGYFMHLMSKYPNMGLRYSCSIGNKMDLSEIEFMEFMINDPTVNIIAVYLESFKNPREFIRLCKEVQKIPNKTIILVKGGLTSQGQKASLSHTGSLAESSELIKAIIKQSGVIQARTFHEMFQFARTFSMMYRSGRKLPKRGNVSMIAGSGGAGTISADLTIQYGLKFPKLSDKTYSVLKEVFPEWMPPNRFALVDIWPAIEKAMMNKSSPEEVMKKVYAAVLEDPEVEGIFNMMFASRYSFTGNPFDSQIENISKFPKPVFFWLVGDYEEIRRLSLVLSEYNMPNFPSLEEMVKNFQILVQEGKNKKV